MTGVERLLYGDTPWSIEYEEGADGNYWASLWHVYADGGGMRLATFEFPEHAEAFVRECGPEGSSIVWDGGQATEGAEDDR